MIENRISRRQKIDLATNSPVNLECVGILKFVNYSL